MKCLRRHLSAKLTSNLSSKTLDINALPQLDRSICDIKTIIIGAGLAGLSAANHLIQNGFKQTIVLEATDRYGGRVSSRKFGDVFCELGAKWISMNPAKNSVYELLRRKTELQLQLKLKQQNELDFVNTNGEKIKNSIPQMIDILFQKLCNGLELHTKYKTFNVHSLDNVHTYFTAESEELIKGIFHNEQEQELAREVFNSLCKEFGSLLGCSLKQVNIEHLCKTQSNMPSPIYMPMGLDNMFTHILTGLDLQNMRVGMPVGEICWAVDSNRDHLTVGCMDGSLFKADHVICTLPLGVLKNFSEYLFKPILPREKMDAIQHLGYGCPVKVYFEYKRNVNNWFRKALRPLWSKPVSTTEPNWLQQVVEISKLPNSNSVLELHVGGFYETIEKMPDISLLDEVTKLMRKCLRNSNVPYPNAVLRSNWSSSACFLGGRPYFSTESTVSDVQALAAPLGQKANLLFAGDATILKGFGTIDGAWASGMREAQRIIDQYKYKT